MGGNKTYHGLQGDKIHPIRDDDIIVLAQTDVTALEEYRTVSAPISDVVNGILDQIKTNVTNDIITANPDMGIVGTGTSESPFSLDINYFNKRWVSGQFVNVSQIGVQSATVLPIDKYGNYVLLFGAPINMQLGGLSLSFPATMIDIRDHVASPDSKTLYMYFILVDCLPKFVITQYPRPERFDATFIGTVVVGVGSITSINTKPFMRLGNYRLSETIQGSAIPVAGGSPWEAGYPVWGGPGTMDPVRAGIDTTQWSGAVTFDHDTETVTIDKNGSFFIQDLAIALANLGPYLKILASGGVDGAMGYLNGINIWKGKGTNYNIYDYSRYVREGWNVVKMEWGVLKIQGPFLR